MVGKVSLSPFTVTVFQVCQRPCYPFFGTRTGGKSSVVFTAPVRIDSEVLAWRSRSRFSTTRLLRRFTVHSVPHDACARLRIGVHKLPVPILVQQLSLATRQNWWVSSRHPPIERRAFLLSRWLSSSFRLASRLHGASPIVITASQSLSAAPYF